MHGYCGSYRWAAGRHRRGRFGGFGFGGRHGGIGGGMNPDDMRAGRMLAQGDLRLVALALIAQAPRHGYEIIKLVEEKTADWYSPSPGIVYRTLTFLEEAGYVMSPRRAKKLYHHRRGPRLSRRQSGSRRRGARPAKRNRRARESLAARGARGTRAAAELATASRSCVRSFARNRGQATSKAMPKRKRIWSKSLPALPVKCSGAIDL